MGKIILSFVLLILGVASCFAVPTMLAMDFIPTNVVDVTTGEETFSVESPSMHLISLRRPGLGQGSALTRSDIPDGTFAFVDKADGSQIEVVIDGSQDFSGQDMSGQFIMVGGAQLDPGTYGVTAPGVGEGLTLSVMKTNFDAADEESMEQMGVGVLVGFGLGALLILAAVVMLILGIVEASRKKNAG